MSVKLNVIKSKDFKVGTVDHTIFVCGYKGRTMTVNTLNIPKEDLTVNGNELTVKVDVDLVNKPYTDMLTGEVKTGLTLLPKLDISVSSF